MTTDQTGKRIEKLSVMQRQTAKYLQRAMSEAVHVTIFAECDVSELVTLRADLKKSGSAPSLTHFLIAAVAQALILYPRFNAHFADEQLTLFEDVNIGLATSMPNGDLVNPVLRGVQHLGASQIAHNALEMTERARAGTLTLAEYSGAGFTLSSVGRTPTPKYATPIIPVPQVAILAAMAVREMAVVRKGALEVAPILPISLGFDHRAINGVEANGFLDSFAAALSRPEDLMVSAIGCEDGHGNFNA